VGNNSVTLFIKKIVTEALKEIMANTKKHILNELEDIKYMIVQFILL